LPISKSFVKFYKTQGISGFFKGNSAALIRIFPFSAIEFYSFEFYKNHIIRGKPQRQNSIFYTLFCGGLTGLNAITLTFPLDVVRTRLAINTANSPVKDSSLLGTLVNLYKKEGMRGLYKGYSIVFIGSIPYVAIKQTTFDILKHKFMVPEYRAVLNFIFGAVSGVIGTTLLYPTHLIKRVFQANSKLILIIFR
jgi:solute carrier family 25 phosphate transporter 23/24/25/41